MKRLSVTRLKMRVTTSGYSAIRWKQRILGFGVFSMAGNRVIAFSGYEIKTTAVMLEPMNAWVDRGGQT